MISKRTRKIYVSDCEDIIEASTMTITFYMSNTFIDYEDNEDVILLITTIINATVINRQWTQDHSTSSAS